MSIVFLEYFFVFDPVETWQHIDQFEGDLSKFLLEHGLEGEIIHSAEDKAGKRILKITKKPIAPPVPETPGVDSVDTSKKRLKAMSLDRQGGKFVKPGRTTR